MTEIDVNNPFQLLYTKLDEILKLIPDINSVRAARTTSASRQYIFPYYPEKNDEDYPRLRLRFANPTVTEYGAGQIVQEVENTAGNVIKTQYGQYLIFDVSIGIFTKKDQIHNVTTSSGSLKPMRNQLLGDTLMYQYFDILRKNRDKFIELGFDIVEGQNFSLTPSYDDNHFLFAADITVPMYKLDIWNTEYSPEELIAIIDYDEIEVDKYEE